jgi:hypothetical protein
MQSCFVNEAAARLSRTVDEMRVRRRNQTVLCGVGVERTKKTSKSMQKALAFS